MDSLAAFQKNFLESLAKGKAMDSSKKLIFCGRLKSFDETFKIYQNNYYQTLKQSLVDTYEACSKILTEKLFEPLAWGFIGKYPLRKNDLASYGESFPRFLASSQVMASFPFIGELAELEKRIGRLLRGEIEKAQMEAIHPVHQIWGCILYGEEDIEDFSEKKMLTITCKNEKIFFQLDSL